jgi:Transposase, Mutator family
VRGAAIVRDCRPARSTGPQSNRRPSACENTNPLERVNKEIGRRSDVVGIYPSDRALIRLAGMLLNEQTDEWLVQRRYLSDHSIRQVLSPPGGSEQSRSNNDKSKEVSTLHPE